MNTIADTSSANKQPLVRVIPDFRFPTSPKPGAALSAVLSAYYSDSPTKQSLTHPQLHQHRMHYQHAGAFRYSHPQSHEHQPQYSDVSATGIRPISDLFTPLHTVANFQSSHVPTSKLAFGGSRISGVKRKGTDNDIFSQQQGEQFKVTEFSTKLQKFNTQIDDTVYEYYPSGV
ncbi:hypothetical protein HK100_006851 [Physocladia obscura]|uniref:Uncharacterized protein n=1 Tax=Physocladia obscura TaxID=109957 RepID=A0AAD5TB24_9FUNG|nr:hypothetical protein HK100_006851 [Physocladia obscura]